MKYLIKTLKKTAWRDERGPGLVFALYAAEFISDKILDPSPSGPIEGLIIQFWARDRKGPAVAREAARLSSSIDEIELFLKRGGHLI